MKADYARDKAAVKEAKDADTKAACGHVAKEADEKKEEEKNTEEKTDDAVEAAETKKCKEGKEKKKKPEVSGMDWTADMPEHIVNNPGPLSTARY